MTAPHLRIDPRLPVVWRDPHTLQIGVDPPALVFPSVEDKFLPLLHELSNGTSPGGIAVFAKEASIDPREIDSFLEQLDPVLGPPPPIPTQTLILDYPGSGAATARSVFETLGYRVRDADSDPRGCEVVILADYVLEPSVYHSWLRRDVVHTPIIFTDQSARIGPRVRPGSSPCLHCFFLHRVSTQPATVAIDSQLWGTHASAHTPALEARAAWVALEMIESDTAGVVSRIDAIHHTIESFAIPPDPQCGCLGLAASPVPGGND